MKFVSRNKPSLGLESIPVSSALYRLEEGGEVFGLFFIDSRYQSGTDWELVSLTS